MSIIALFNNVDILLINNNLQESKTLQSFKIKCPTTSEHNKNLGKIQNSPNNVIFTAVSPLSNFVAACDSNNSMHLWIAEREDWKYLGSRSLSRRCQKVIFTNSSKEVIVADRNADVYSFSTCESGKPGEFLLGHICLIMDVAISADDKFLATSDRDGKIRVSHFPNCYNILMYCLGHKEFVSSVCFIDASERILASTSGDGTLRFWNFVSGSEKSCFSFSENQILQQGNSIDVSSEQKLKIVMDTGSLYLKEEEIKFSARSIKFNEKHSILITLFHLQSGIAVYDLSRATNQDYQLNQYIILKSVPIDALFVLDLGLLVLYQSKSDNVDYFEFCKEKREFIKVQDSNLPSTVNDVKEFYSDSNLTVMPCDFVTLFKRSYDDDKAEDCQSKKNKKS